MYRICTIFAFTYLFGHWPFDCSLTNNSTSFCLLVLCLGVSGWFLVIFLCNSDAIYSFFSALGNSVEFLLNDYGVFPTIIAATTLGAMFFLAFVVIRTLSPKRGKNYSDKHNNTLHNERRKKKKKGGNARHRNNHHNHRSNNNNNSRIKTTLRSRSQDVENEKVETDSTTEAIPCSPIPSPPPADVPENNILSLTSSSPLEKSLDNPLEVPSISTATASATILDNNSIESSQETAKNVPTDKRISIGSSKSAAKENHMNTNKTRRRVTSASTADTTPLSDDQSCGSTSVRSFPSVSVNSNRSAGKKTKNTTPRRLKRHGTVKSPKSTERNSGKKNMNNHATSVESPGTTSRWDALKPNNGNAGKNNNNNSKNSTHGVHHSHSNGTTGNNKKQNQRQRGNSRRNANGRKGRPHPKSLAQNDDPSVASDKLRVNQSRANTEAPSIGSMRQESKTFCPNNPFAPSASQSSPTPPPGFQNSSHYEFGTKSSSHQYSQQQQYTNDNLTAAPLFGSPLAVRSPQDGSSNIAGVSPKFFNNSESTARTIQENPFRSDVPAISGSLSLMENHSYQRRHQSNIDSQIEADLQELGGQMAGSILDF